MRGPASAALALCGVGLLAVAIHAAGQRIELSEAPGEAPATAGQGTAASDVLRREQPARPAGSSIVPPAASQEVALERIEPRAPLTAPREEDRTPKPTLLHRPVALAAGRVEAGGHRIEIAGLRVTEPERTCQRKDGGTWPCGTVARTAFRNWLRGRAIECAVAPKPLPEMAAVPCSLGKSDVGRWLAEQGFSEAAGESPYAESVKAAQTARRGIWGDGPPGR